MSTIPTQIRIDSNIKKQASDLFEKLGLDMSSAVNIFLHQCVLHGGLPFTIGMPQYNESMLAAMAEAKRISRDPTVQSYNTMDELRKALDD